MTARWAMRGVLLFLLCFSNLNEMWSPDVVPNALLSWTVLRQGDVTYDEFAIERDTYFFRACGASTATAPATLPRSAGGPPQPGPADHVCSIFPPGIGLLALPFYAPFVIGGASPGDPAVVLRVGHAVAALLETAAALLLWSLALRFVSARAALALALLYLLGTSVRTVGSQALWQHAGVHAAIAFALWQTLRAEVTARRALLAGLAAGFGVVVRQTTALLAPALLVTSARAAVLGLAAGALPLLVYNVAAFGSPLEQGYGAKPFDPGTLAGGIGGLLVSPSRGLLVYEPWTIAALASLALAWLRRGAVAARLRRLGLSAAAMLLLYASYAEWWGGRVFGPRFLDDLAPVLVAALAWGIGEGLLRGRLRGALFAAAAAWSLLLFGAAALVYTGRWDLEPRNVNFAPDRLFDWSDPQWLAVLRELPSGGGRVLAAVVLTALLLALLGWLERGGTASIVATVTTAFLVFFGRGGAAEVERRLDRFKIAIGASVLRRAGAAGYEPLIAVTADAEAGAAFRAAGASVESEIGRPFHFGRELRGIAARRGCERLVAIGAGAGALLEVDELRGIRERLEGAAALVLSNNAYSADLVGLTPASALDAIALPATDNPLPRLLHQQGGLPIAQLERSAATLLDVDTPADATVLLRHPRCPAELHALGAWEAELGGRIDALMKLITTAERELVVAGRVGAPVWTYLESQTACRVRMLAEERGMQSAGRDASGEARTALGFLYARTSPPEFFESIAELGDGLIFDTRVLFTHLGWRPEAADRFASDLFQAEAVSLPDVRAFTAAARDARIPVLLGGHTLVSGVLWTMVEAAWSGHPLA